MALNVSGLNITLNHTITTAVSPGTIEVINTIKPLLFFLLGMTIYALFIFKFYRFLAERDILKLKLHHKYEWKENFLTKVFKTFFYLLEHVILVPILVFFWFAIMAGLLIVLSKNTPDQVMIISMAIIGAVRITAYYNEDLSKDLAKMIPFALLGVFIVDMNFISFTYTFESAKQLLNHTNEFLFYLIFVAGLELFMRIVHLIHRAVSSKEQLKDELKEKKETFEDR